VVTFAKGSYSVGLWARHSDRAKRGARGVNTSGGKVTWIQDPVDARGVPIIGRGTSGAIRGTRPGDGLFR
jgi:hypothetical protein